MFTQLKKTTKTDKIADWLFDHLRSKGKLKDDNLQDLKRNYIRENVRNFRERIFDDKSIGISKVNSHKFKDISENRRGILKMFQRLNSNGTKLSQYELIASTLKCFDYEVGRFLNEVTAKYADIGIKQQDILIKMLLVFRDKPDKDMLDITADDSIFVKDNLERIKATFEALRVFLKVSKHAEWFQKGNVSVLPLYFLAYHIFHKSEDPETVRNLFDKFTPNDQNFKNMSLWLKLVLLNRTYKTGCGWDPTKTGMKLTHEILSKYCGEDFPIEALFKLYKNRNLKFYDDKNIKPGILDLLDRDYIFYLMYDGNMALVFTPNVDHIHPKSVLGKAGVSQDKINSIGNLQLLQANTNKGKNDKEFRDWVYKDVPDKKRNGYLRLHLIPKDESLWTSDNFTRFLDKRLGMIAKKIKDKLNE